MQQPLKDISGFSLISMLVATVMMGIGAVIFTEMLTNNDKMASKTQGDVDITAIKRMLIDSVHCKNTLLDSSGNERCTAEDKLIYLRDKKNNVLGDPSKTKDGGYLLAGYWYVRSQCKGENFDVRIAKVTKDGEYYSHPLNKEKKLNYQASMNPLFAPVPVGIPLCGSANDGKIKRGRYQSGNRPGYPRFIVLAGEEDDFIINTAAGASICSDSSLTNVAYRTHGGDEHTPLGTVLEDDDGTPVSTDINTLCNKFIKIECNSEKGLSLVSCSGSNVTSTTPKFYQHGNGCIMMRSDAMSYNISCIED